MNRLAALLVIMVGVTPALAAEEDHHPLPYPTLTWAVVQLIPSPEIAGGSAGAHFGMRWQLTPFLYSWGIHRGLYPFRFFVAEPLIRQSGSIELFVTPEYVGLHSSLADDSLLRTGVRSYFPVYQKGEYVSVSLGASHFLFEGRSGAAIEGGIYVLSGVMGLQLTYSPSPTPVAWIATFRLRYF